MTDTDSYMSLKKTAEGRFWKKVDKTEDCWLWTASCFHNGYGQFWLSGRGVRAHRISFEWANGEIPEGMQVDHRCHTRNCVRPDHLRLVTHAQNAQNRRGAQVGTLTGVRSVSWHKASNKYWTYATLNGKTYSAGYHRTLEEAEAAVIAKRRELFTHDYADWSTAA